MDKEYKKQIMKRWKDANKDKIKEYNKEYNKKIDKDKIKEQHKKWNSLNKNKTIEQSRSRIKYRYENDPLFRMSHSLRSLIFDSFKRKNCKKPKKTEHILGCSMVEFKKHIESQFESWMDWNNKGKRNVSQPQQCWDIDHIIPISSAKTEEDLIRLNHYTNLRPFCSYTNRWVKRAK